MTVQTRSHSGKLLASLAAGCTLLLPFSVAAQSVHHHRNFAQKHPVLTGVAAGVAAHHIAKTSGRHRAQEGGHRNFAQRHPVLTGVAAGVAVHHVANHHHNR